MSSEERRSAEPLSAREIVTTRVFDAPRERVFKAWTDPEHLVRWWGPKGFTNTFQPFDPKPGGVWRFVMHGPDGADYKNESVFVEIVRPERIVFQHVSGPAFLVTATYAEQAGRTKVTFQMLFETAAACEKVKGSPSRRTSRTSTAWRRSWPECRDETGRARRLGEAARADHLNPRRVERGSA